MSVVMGVAMVVVVLMLLVLLLVVVVSVVLLAYDCVCSFHTNNLADFLGNEWLIGKAL